MFYPNLIPFFITILLLPQVFVHGGLLRELGRKFVGFFKWSKSAKPGPFYDKCNLCTFGPCTPMVWPTDDKNFDAAKEAEALMNNLKQSDANDNLPVDYMIAAANILVPRSAIQRTAIAEAFEKKYSKTVERQIASRMQKGFRYFLFMEFLSSPLPQYYHEQFKLYILYQGMNKETQERGQAAFVDMFTTLPQCLLDKAIESYNSNPKQDLVTDLDKALTKVGRPEEYREVMKKMIEGKRDSNQRASWFKALREAYKLKSAIISQRETEMKERFAEFFIKRSIPQILETIVVYENLRHGDKDFVSFSKDVDNYKGGEKDIYSVMMSLFTNKPLYYAKLMEYILKIQDQNKPFAKRITYIFAGRFDIDLADVINEYNKQSQTGLRADFLAWDTDYWAPGFHEIILGIIDKASSKP